MYLQDISEIISVPFCILLDEKNRTLKSDQDKPCVSSTVATDTTRTRLRVQGQHRHLDALVISWLDILIPTEWTPVPRLYPLVPSTLCLFNIAMENGPFIDGEPIKNGDFPWLC